MSELQIETVTCAFDEQGKPLTNVEPGSALLAVDAPGECLVEQADPEINLGSASCPRRCGSCGTTGYVENGVYHSTADTAANFCGRYTNQPVLIELAAAACNGAGWTDLRPVATARPTPDVRTVA